VRTSKLKQFAPRAFGLLPWIALLAIIIGARLWLISGYGSALPFHDQWDGEAARVFKPWLENTLRWPDLFAPHNEHRLVLTRLLALGLLQANGQWDGLLEMTVNAFLCGLIGLGIAAGLLKILGAEYRIPVLVAVTLWLALPYAHENTLWGFQSAFYFLVFFSFLAIWGMGFFPACSWNWWLGVISAVLACFSSGSGFFAAGVVLILEAIRLVSKTRRFIEAAPTSLLCIAVVVLGLCLRVTHPPHEILKAASIGAWLNVFARSLAWPYCAMPLLIIVTYLPWAISTFLMLRTSEARSRSRSEILFGLGVWVIAESAAIAYARGADGNITIASRYMDILGLGAILNVFCVVILVKRTHWMGKHRSVAIVCGALWIAGLLRGALLLSDQKLSEPGKEVLLPMEENVRGYVATRDQKYLTGDLPYPHANQLAEWLDDPTIRKILPAVVRPALPLEIRYDAGSAFIAKGYPAAIANPPYEKTWGSYSESGTEARGSMESESFRSDLPYLQFEVAGNPRGATVLSLRNVKTGKEARVATEIRTNPDWRASIVRVPGHDLKIIARDDSMEDWIAFREPRELGWLSYYTQQLVSNRQNLFRVGAAILAVAITSAFFAALYSEELEKQRN
jgi:hypothetical protein